LVWDPVTENLNAAFLAAQTSSSLLALTTLSLLVPAAFSATADTKENAEVGVLNLSHGTSLILLVVYILFLIFQVRMKHNRGSILSPVSNVSSFSSHFM
jgi:calcium/proton exchanger cax